VRSSSVYVFGRSDDTLIEVHQLESVSGSSIVSFESWSDDLSAVEAP
jgi:hypothetical protein